MPKNNFATTAVIGLIMVALTQANAQSTNNSKESASPVTSNAKETQKPSVAPLSSAKTIRELLETDDAMALTRQKKAALDELKKIDKDSPVVAIADKAGVTKRSDYDLKLAAEKAKKTLESTIRVVSVVGVQGYRLVNANIGGRLVAIREDAQTAVGGWKMVNVNGACATFERLLTNQESKPTKPVKLTKRKATTPVIEEGVTKTACFTRPDFSLTPSQFSSATPFGSLPTPFPVPLPVLPRPNSSPALSANAINDVPLQPVRTDPK